MLHSINLIIHITAGTLALIAGILALLYSRRLPLHKRYGLIFVWLLSTVVASGFIGWLFFRSNPFLLMLTILSGYVCFAGYRNIQLREQRGTWLDVSVSVGCLLTGISYVASLTDSVNGWSPSVIVPTLSALILVTTYDLIKNLWSHRWLKRWWIYEHIYKMVSAYSAILSAFVGTVLPDFKPYSQIGPSVFGVWLIILLIWRRAARAKSLQKARA